MDTIAVNIPGAPYSIHVSGEEKSWAAPLGRMLPEGRAVVLTSRRVARHVWPRFKKAMDHSGIQVRTFLLDDGEPHKTLDNVAKGYRALLRLKADRHTHLVILGGGVLGDLGGFVASTYLRGIPFIQVPTTLVAQVDSSIGGKVGVDLPEGKNLVGAFAQPRAVFSHVPFLQTLSRRDLTGGLGEVIKYGIIKDPALMPQIRKRRTAILEGRTEALYPLVLRSSEIKAEVVSQDEKESGLRMILNFGHTFGHAIEKLTRYRTYHHGEAVAMGMMAAARVSEKLGLCRSEDSESLQDVLRAVGLPTELPAFSRGQWVRALAVDKKSRGGKIRFVFMKRPGVVAVQPISPVELVKCIL